MKQVLVISPYFPPTNAADVHRVRMSLPYFKEFGWEPTIVTVDVQYSEMVKDELLCESVPAETKIYSVKAFDKKITSKLGLGSIGLRSLWFYRKKVNSILKAKHFDLVYFSTTQFPVCILGAYWKKRFHVPYVIDMQDPWHSEYYKDKPKNQQPPKYWFSYRLNKYLEPVALKKTDGLISVSDDYIKDLKKRYPEIKDVPADTITFGAFEPDLKIAVDNSNKFTSLLQPGFINVVYVGRGGLDMHNAIAPVFESLKKGLTDEPALFNKLRFYFIGTSYAPAGTGTKTIMPLAIKYGVEEHVIEITDRISFYHSLTTLQQADALFIPGSDDPKYTASKLYPYLLTQNPLLAIFNSSSNAIQVLKDCTTGAFSLTFDEEPELVSENLYRILSDWADKKFSPVTLTSNFQNYSAQNLTLKQVQLFEKAIGYYLSKNINA